jgi:pentatricopeptide repeat protein
MLNGDFRRRSSTSEGGGSGSNSFPNNNRSSFNEGDRSTGRHSGSSNHRDSGNFSNDRRFGTAGDRGDDRGRGQVIMGLDVQALVDLLCRHNCDAFRELDTAREDHLAVFQSGKAVTAIISNLARRRNLRLATTVWDWIDSVGIKKNTFHYNSMISVCEKVRDYTKALKLLDEMKEKGVPKNEVTYVYLHAVYDVMAVELNVLYVSFSFC